eukprot:gene905-biopygen164
MRNALAQGTTEGAGGVSNMPPDDALRALSTMPPEVELFALSNTPPVVDLHGLSKMPPGVDLCLSIMPPDEWVRGRRRPPPPEGWLNDNAPLPSKRGDGAQTRREDSIGGRTFAPCPRYVRFTDA